ncbi:hypothetical protein quinque_007000 [Culex quinquefasciatus]
MISCKCLNVVVRTVPTAGSGSAESAGLTGPSTPSDDHFLFFKEALGPVRCSSVQVQFDDLVRTVRLFDEWDLHQCRNCRCCVFAGFAGTPASSADKPASCLVNASLVTNEDQLNARMADGSYSPAFGIVLNSSELSYSDLAEKSRLLSMTKSGNTFVQLLRAYMERETEAANARIHRFTEQEFAVLKVKRERAEQDCMILAKRANNVPELMLRSNSISERPMPTTTTTPTSKPLATKVSPMTAVGTHANGATHLNDSGAGGPSQLETPPPTPEYLPMSTGNSPPMVTSNGVARSRITPPSSADQSSGTTRPGSNHNNNNNIVSFSNNTRGAIAAGRQPQQQPQHSSTNSLLQMQQQQQRLATSSFESDCMFDIDGMENDKSPLTLSDEEDLGLDESTGNNNEDGIYIPARHSLGRQSSSIAKSLPISMPQVMTQFRATEEDYDEMAEDNVDIAASIKALARSVHGDTVFGDLPRPQVQRFSTQI